MEIKKFLKNFVLFGALYNTVISGVFILSALSMSPSAENMQYCTACGLPQNATFLDANRLFAILIFSFIMSLGTAIFCINGISKLLAHLSHAACFIVGFLVFLILCEMGFAKACIGTALFAIGYVIVRAIQMLIKKLIRKVSGNGSAKAPTKVAKAPKSSGYVNQFKK